LVEQCNVVRWIPPETCEFGCQAGRCLGYPIEYVGVALGMLILAGGLGFYVRKRKRRERGG
jgi:LPXTG-motif cell wall-anchored protein